MIIEDVSSLPERAKRELIRGEYARAEFAIRAQSALKEAMDQMGPVRHVEGIGRKIATIHPDLTARIRVKFGVRCLHDPDFLHRLLQANPFLRVQTIPAKLTVRVDGFRKPDTGNRKVEEEVGRAEARPSGRLDPAYANPPSPRLRARQGATAGQGFQNGMSHGATGDPAPPSDCCAKRGSVSSFSSKQRSGHETAARSENPSKSPHTKDTKDHNGKESGDLVPLVSVVRGSL